MGLNETLDRLKAEREQKKIEYNDDSAKLIIANLADRVFFQRMLKDINMGMSERKIDEMIDRSVMIATKLYCKLYKNEKTKEYETMKY